MARSIRDDMKRKIAQAVNHCGGAVLDINDVYEQFRESHAEEAEFLKTVMLNIASLREMLIGFASAAWELDEESLSRWM